MKSIGTGYASGKIILMGEHSVVYGEPAIAFPFSGTGIQATIRANKLESWIESSFFHGPLSKAPNTMRNVTILLWQLVKYFKIPEPFYLKIESSIPAERGMGSSAAVAVAITRAVFDWMEEPMTQKKVLHFVNQAETVAHGNPSGIDATTISGTEPILYQKGIGFQSFQLNMDAFLVVADTGIKGQTRKAVRDIAQLMELRPYETNKQMQTLGKLTTQAQQAVLQNQPHILGDCMNQAQGLLRLLGTSNRQLDHLIETALENQALGAKLTGGGRGGCMIALAEDETSGRRLQQILLDAGARNTWIEGLGVYAHV
ncbi:mevalonate kinase [Enterococcus dongliensis]|uniref:Mevalonate kinase n=1 Tax=Enterococcus dongliensis TaxID=2559925 RepID=A0AAP5NM68_9ENTE|nr:mevalonate kinase [Enterococcus dongliensis]MDT2596212.1 mevalonate kinase [Enterococcus dongliensis]MDT2603933.1 mevalonate kinase [Enterococcus dongliensis]MDT2613933.1 mevalonate kinase [Enterococcus dongliensis]MDT2634171.1 mevalonate kinase [Enterococcus dongliensis]MDT2637101.1 mevalonate kinase [Enterococcus dongliensis]